jgi:hypothetical protein
MTALADQEAQRILGYQRVQNLSAIFDKMRRLIHALSFG